MKTYQVKRSDETLKELYNTSYKKWRDVLRVHLNENPFDEHIHISENLINEAFKDANQEQKKLINKLFPDYKTENELFSFGREFTILSAFTPERPVHIRKNLASSKDNEYKELGFIENYRAILVNKQGDEIELETGYPGHYLKFIKR